MREFDLEIRPVRPARERDRTGAVIVVLYGYPWMNFSKELSFESAMRSVVVVKIYFFAWGPLLPEMIPDSKDTESMSRTEVHAHAYKYFCRISEI